MTETSVYEMRSSTAGEWDRATHGETVASAWTCWSGSSCGRCTTARVQVVSSRRPIGPQQSTPRRASTAALALSVEPAISGAARRRGRRGRVTAGR
jgi:hypothetical protein